MKTFLVIAFAAVMAFSGCACGGQLPAADDPELLDLAAKLTKCRVEARAAVQTADASPQDAYLVYTACKKDGGI